MGRMSGLAAVVLGVLTLSVSGTARDGEALPLGEAVTFQTKDSLHCLGVDRALDKDGTQLGRFKCDRHLNQVWRVSRKNGAEHQFVNQNSGKCIGVDFASTNVGAKIIQFSCKDDRNQAWTLLGEGNPVVKISNAKSRLCLGVNAAERLAVQLDCNSSGDIKQWRVVPRRRDTGPQ
jgi:Ricin-type beta-trefoil lectin domain